jgi:FdrA protein
LAPAIADARRTRDVEFVAVVIGTDEDPQGLESQVETLRGAGALVFEDLTNALSHVVDRLGGSFVSRDPQVDLESLTAPIVAVNLGLELFAASLVEQGALAIHVEWSPPAGGDDRLMAILERMRR